ncbi:D-alanyl-D-alanine carboxypeptidase [Streptomyces sp. RLB1-33]|jgi:D-alanyl-D-alanine carboxypeptidase (penicillin-binding protein 5/6)|uniref:D-alanyl-D-alanine carboxypeptidase family protein n=1 Tax=Streptomyces mirabilis TaxID=68239 RepID=UPI00143EA86A|nr:MULTISPECIES: D-alanyl-D-alanine carboxypeptidase [Streptomyces]QIY70704.1 D-alanyl-D-alanine carboxypeptidase [Streptomyces sp. RLB1-33]QUW82385.1 D-alanyl-D-alanine carboxypeptidase [Streptomyces mirabilis]
MRDSSPVPPRAAQLSRRAALGLAAAVPLAAASPASAATPVIGGERLAGAGVQVRGASGLPKRLTARSWLVADHESGEVLASYHAHTHLAPASTLKMLFADTVLKNFERTERHRVTDADLADIPSGSSMVGVKPGITYTVEQLWLGVFLRSGNDAVHVLSHMNGGLARTVAQMQAKAQDLQALDTHVVSPDGFDHKGQVSSAYDLTLFARHGLADADFRAYCHTKTANFPAGGKKTFQIQNTDRLLTGAWGVPTYDGLIGVKNGYTSNAGNTFTGAATRGGRTLLVTVMHPKSGGSGVYEETAALLDWGFKEGAKAQSVGALVDPLSEGGASAAPTRKAAKAAAGAPATAAGGGSSSWGLVGGAGGAVALLAGGAYAWRRRRRVVGDEALEEPQDRQNQRGRHEG